MKNIYIKTALVAMLMLFPFLGQAQTLYIVSGTISELTGEPIVGVNIVEKGTSNGTISSIDGSFFLELNSEPATLVFSFIGYTTKEIAVSSQAANLQVELEENIQSLQDVIIVGTRFNARSELTSPVPIDKITASELESSGQLSIDQMITYKIQSYNASQQTISDATAHFNPADLRGLGPSRTLVLINGKRKNASALVYVNDTPGKGEVGVDMQSIPVSAIKRIEILRDGASAQYGSDAIAGVINIVLKDNFDYTDINIFSGVTSEGDGFNAGFNANAGFNLTNDGYFNVSAGYKFQDNTNRAGSPGKDDLFGVDGSNPWIQKNPDLGMTVGMPKMTTFDVFYNLDIPLKNQAHLYSFGGATYRNGESYALYRTPYWVDDPDNIFHKPGETYNGFQPTFGTDIHDRTFAIGAKGKLNEWDFDVSVTTGSNTVDYTIGNTMNVDLGRLSPTTFNAGGYEFRNMVQNIDLHRKFGNFTLGFGSEFRTENFVTNAGEEASYVGSGAQSFPGLQPLNEVNQTRFNIGFYTDLEYEINSFLIGGALRYENYSDFGNTLNWKINARLKLLEDKMVVRASANTGFRAPSLHQIYLSNIQTLISAGTVSNQGTFNNNSPVIRDLEVPTLKEEEAFNYSFGITLNPAPKLDITLDYYNVAVDDRVVFTNEIASSTPPISDILDAFDVTSIKFFINAVNTNTSGFDAVVSYSDLSAGRGAFNFNLAFNANKTSIEGKIKTPKPIEDSGAEIFNRKEQSRIETARPNNKILLGVNYTTGKFSTTANFTRFGEVSWKHADDASKDQTFSAKLVTDLYLSYKFTEQFRFSLNINNLLNVYPDKIDTKGDPVTDLGGRFQYPWEVNQFGFMGTTIQGTLGIRF